MTAPEILFVVGSQAGEDSVVGFEGGDYAMKNKLVTLHKLKQYIN